MLLFLIHSPFTRCPLEFFYSFPAYGLLYACAACGLTSGVRCAPPRHALTAEVASLACRTPSGAMLVRPASREAIGPGNGLSLQHQQQGHWQAEEQQQRQRGVKWTPLPKPGQEPQPKAAKQPKVARQLQQQQQLPHPTLLQSSHVQHALAVVRAFSLCDWQVHKCGT